MKRLLLGALLLAAGLTGACGGGSGGEGASPTTAITSAAGPPGGAKEVIAFTQEFPVLYRVDNPDGTFQLKPSTMKERVDALCADEPQWSVRQEATEWRVIAECKKEESISGEATPPPYGFETLHFEWLYYPDLQRVMPVSQAAHDAQYPFPQPSPFPTLSPLP